MKHHEASSFNGQTPRSVGPDHGTDVELVKESVAFLIGYIDTANGDDGDPHYGRGTAPSGRTRNQQVGERVQQLVVETFQEVDKRVSLRNEKNETKLLHASHRDDSSLDPGAVRIVSSTQASVAKLRHSLLTQEGGCSAVGDVMTITLTVPKGINQIGIWKHVVDRVKLRLREEGVDGEPGNARLLAGRLLDKDCRFHAERACTQRIYHYLLPLSWLPDGDQLEEWWRQPEAHDIDAINSPHDQMKRHGNHRHNIFAKKLAKPPPSLRRLKSALRSAESSKIAMNDVRSDTNKTLRVASGRYGALAGRARRAWHSFACPDLCGDASPNNEPVWRVIDKARIVGFVENKDADAHDELNSERRNSICAVVEIKGDDFVPEQIRRIVASAIAMTHGWLPEDFFSLSTSVNTVLNTPLAPPGRLYMAGSRFHFDELEYGGLPFFEECKSRRILQSWNASSDIEIQQWMQKELLKRKELAGEVDGEAAWLSNLCKCICPRIRQRIAESHEDVPELSLDGNALSDDDLSVYKPVLSELLRILSAGEWPETSVARSSVILATHEEEVGVKRPVASGSFTIVNPLVASTLETSLPVANTLFPGLVEDVFRLEQMLSHQKAGRVVRDGLETNMETGRPVSSHCAINCNAQFTPHVDTGVGTLLQIMKSNRHEKHVC